MAALKPSLNSSDRAIRHAWRDSYKVRGIRVARQFRGFGWFVLCAILVFALLSENAFACPTCKEGLANGHDGVGLGYYWSILFMMSTPFLIFTAWAFFIWRALRKQPLAVHEPVFES